MPNKFDEFKIEFAPGCFDEFDGTQEELDELVKQLTDRIKSGELVVIDSIELDNDEIMHSCKKKILN